MTQARHLAKSKCNPGYGGFVPKIRSENLVGRNNSELSKEAFVMVGSTPYDRMSTTGFVCFMQVQLQGAARARPHSIRELG